jgi:hypothetical protein
MDIGCGAGVGVNAIVGTSVGASVAARVGILVGTIEAVSKTGLVVEGTGLQPLTTMKIIVRKIPGLMIEVSTFASNFAFAAGSSCTELLERSVG